MEQMSLCLVLAQTPQEKRAVNNIIEKHHSYVKAYRSVGRRIDWLISLNGNTVGMIGVGSSTYPPSKDMLTYLGLSKAEYRATFNTFANNWRFCLTKGGIRNLGTRVLKLFRERAVVEWKNKYGDPLRYLITFVGGGHDGAVYRADNWVCVGKTAGLPPNRKSVSMKWHTKEEIREKFVKPTGKHKKLIFIKRL